MAGVLSKFRITSGKEEKTNLPVKTIPAKKNISGHKPASKKLWILGGIFILFLILVLIALVISTQQTRQNTAQLEIVARLQMHDQRLSKATQQALLGHESAFAQLKDSQNQHNHFISLLSQGGSYRNGQISPVTDPAARPHLESYISNWQQEEKKINLIVNNQESLVYLSRVINEINAANKQLSQSMEQLTDHLRKIDHSPNEIIAVETMKALTQNVTKSVNSIFPSAFPIAEIKGQLAQDRQRFSTIIQALNQGNNGLSLISIDDKLALEKLSEISTLFRNLDNHIGIVQQHISGIINIKFAASEIVKNSEVMLSLARALDDELQLQDINNISLLNIATYSSGACAILALFLFSSALRKNTHHQLLASQNEIEKTQKAILRLLDDMKKIADGDLTARTVVTEDITGAIADSINYTVEELHTLVAQVNKASAQVVKASNQAQNVSSELLTAAQQQSIKIEETTIAVLGMTESISEVSDTATESAKVAKQSLATAEKGNIAVRESIAGMNEIRTHIQDTSKRIKRLGESSQEIGEIVALISDITEQTNVLALNAALQATAAGEAGRGFTVIAQEVQRLAERSAEATKQVSGLIRTIQGDTQDTIAAMERSTLGVAKGAKRSDAAGQALEEIEEVSKKLAQLVTSIFDTTHAQTQAANKVVENMEEILHITRQATEGTTQTTSSIKQISGFASELKASVSRFKV
jgi:twitching motility protein PilJ